MLEVSTGLAKTMLGFVIKSLRQFVFFRATVHAANAYIHPALSRDHHLRDTISNLSDDRRESNLDELHPIDESKSHGKTSGLPRLKWNSIPAPQQLTLTES